MSLKISGKKLKDKLSVLEVELDEIMEELQKEGQKVPNLTHPDVPIGGEEVATLRKLVSIGKTTRFKHKRIFNRNFHFSFF